MDECNKGCVRRENERERAMETSSITKCDGGDHENDIQVSEYNEETVEAPQIFHVSSVLRCVNSLWFTGNADYMNVIIDNDDDDLYQKKKE